MKFTLYNVGKTDSVAITNLLSDYISRIRRFADFEIIDLPGLKNTKNLSPDLIRKKEGEAILKHTQTVNYLVLLDEKGKAFSSVAFASWVQQINMQSFKHVGFVSGGAYGFSSEVYAASNLKLSLSKMTFTHQMVRLFFTEQFYRALTIINGLPYHNE